MNTTQIKYTHDRRPVYPAGSALPQGASGWTQCKLGAGYAIWLLDADRARSKADLERFTAEARKLRTRAAAVTALEAIGVTAYPEERLSDLRLSLVNHMYAMAWPLIEV